MAGASASASAASDGSVSTIAAVFFARVFGTGFGAASTTSADGATSSASGASATGGWAAASSSAALAATETSLRMSIRQPVRRAARRAFWPSRPIANDSIRSGTVTLAIRFSSSMSTPITWAGDSAFATKTLASSFHGMMSIFSPPSSATTAWTRAPRWPTVAPTGSRPSWRDETATFEREPGSRAIALISTVPLWISGTSSSNRRLRKPLWVRLTRICGPRLERRTSRT